MLKIWNIGKANAEIERLEAANAALTKECADLKAAAESNVSEVAKSAEQVAADLATAKQTVGTLTGQLEAANTALAGKDAEIKALGEKLAAKGEEVKVTVAAKVMETQAALGQPAAPTPPKEAKDTTATSGISRVISAATADLEKAGYVRKN